jgi:hypothetical protein
LTRLLLMNTFPSHGCEHVPYCARAPYDEQYLL